MSWLARSIVNTLSHNDDERDKDDDFPAPTPDIGQKQTKDSLSLPSSPRGVKEDLSELTKTLTRQLWGVASFLAPPPQSDQAKDSKSVPEESDSDRVAGFRSDFAEIRGKFKSGFSKLSDNIHVAEISKMASDFLQLADADDCEGGDGFDSADAAAVGVTEQVIAFARDIAMHPETWLDFPLPEDQDDGDDDDEDFDMSDAQQEHALAVERLAPRLAALRIELCPGYMSEAQFWKIYFVLLHPRLDKQDALVLSTPQIMKARASLATELQNRRRAIPDNKPREPTVPSQGITNFQNEVSLSVQCSDAPSDVFQTTSATELATSGATDDCFSEKHPISEEIPIVDEAVIGGGHVNQNKDHNMPSSGNSWEKNEEEDNDDWLKEESLVIGVPNGTTFSMENDEDVSFSDLEEDDGDEHSKANKVNYTSDKDSRDWVELSKSSGDSSSNKSVAGATKVNLQTSEAKDSSDWLDVDDIDVA